MLGVAGFDGVAGADGFGLGPAEPCEEPLPLPTDGLDAPAPVLEPAELLDVAAVLVAAAVALLAFVSGSGVNGLRALPCCC